MLFAECNRERAFISIVITIIPSWAILTTLIVFVLLSFHRNLRSTKVYDDCSKANAQYVYYLDLRTGDTSPSYAKRRTTLTIDMFDDNQATLARIFIPGHVIFGRKDAPIMPIDDDRFSDLRVTRFWLYRATKLKKVTTIRLTHNCTELDARIMVYAVELRTDESERFRIFFPVMSYISVYGATSKPNACFDAEPLGFISVIGGHISDITSIDEHLSWIDIILLINFGLSIIFYLTGIVVVPKGDYTEFMQFAYNGCLAGLITYVVVLVLGLTLRFVIRQNYSRKLGRGNWSIVYYSYSIFLFLAATTTWIMSAVTTFKHLCPDLYGLWILAVCVGLFVALILALITYAVHFVIQLLNPPYLEQYVVPDDLLPDNSSKGRQQVLFRHNTNLGQSPIKTSPTNMMPPTAPWQHQHQLGYHIPQAYGHPVYAQVQQPAIPPTATAPNAPLVTAYKTQDQSVLSSNHVDHTLSGNKRIEHRNQHPPHQHQDRQQTTAGTRPQTPQELYQQHGQTYNQQIAGQGNPDRPLRKIGSNESTGSTYYQQLIKTKGGVKSISQYGELLRQKKMTKQNK